MIKVRSVFFTACWGLCIGWLTTTATPTPPNVLLIVADDLGYSDIGAFGGEIHTPNLDRLAREGTRYTQFYNNGVCVVTRASLYTGGSPRQGPAGMLRPNMITLGNVMQAAGYRTSLIGKWHLGSEAPRRPIDRGFDDYYGVLSGACNYFDPSIPDPSFYSSGERAHRPFAHNNQRVTEFPEDYYTTDAFSTHAVKMIQQAGRDETPFFINLCYTAPHFPLQAPKEDIAKYKGRYAEGYRKLRKERFARQVAMGLIDPAVTQLRDADPKTSPYRYDYEVPRWAELREDERALEESRMEVYAAMVDRMDQGIGRVLTALEASGMADNTLVIFLSDNGGCASQPKPENMAAYRDYNRGVPIGQKEGYEFVGPAWGWAQNTPFRRYKGWNYEGGICTPMIVRWPGQVRTGAIDPTPGHVNDFMPTMLEMGGVNYHEVAGGKAVIPLEGESLLPQLTGQPVKPRRGFMHWAYGGSRAVRDGDLKLVWGASDRRWELYDLKVDRAEAIDISEQMPAQVRAMVASWNIWAKLTEAPGIE